jgi:selenide,water dikinase
LPKLDDPNLLVGIETGDDAAVYRLGPELALIQTVDYFTPIVDDPYSFGAIAAANALSDIYAMGGRPLLALNIVGFPIGKLSVNVLGEILRGGAEKAMEAGALIVGGHSIDDNEPKYGLAVTGLIHPDLVVTNKQAQVGDDLILTKPLGMGIISTAIKKEKAPPSVVNRAIEVMSTLNRGAAEAMAEVGAHACTDITGFGLLGHLYGMTRASGVGASIKLSNLPILSEVWELAKEGCIPGGTRRNYDYLQEKEAVVWDPGIDETTRLVVADAQTSGGLLISVAKEKSRDLLSLLETKKTPAAALIGEIVENASGQIRVEL